MNHNFPRTFVVLLVACWLCAQSIPTATASDRPNVLTIMVDDLGFSDIGCYGGEIATPNLDRLAENGLRFSQFYNTAKCHSSRVSLLTGQYCIAAGDTSLTHAVTSAEVLRANEYFTAMTGKWHLKQEPTDFGFDRYFGHLSGACNFFLGDKTFRLNGQPWTVPSQGFYTTVADVDFGLQFLREADKTTNPWHLYIAFNAPHAPLQALPEDYAKYEGRYDQGWDKIRQTRLARQKSLRLLPDDLSESPRPAHIPAWDQLTEPRQQFEIKRMTALAGMIDRVDQEIGRLLEYLETTGQLDNTLIWFVSDNGACPYDRTSNNIDAKPTSGSVSWSDSTGWAWARNSPFRYYKQNQFEGGIRTPGIVHWPNGLKAPAGSICRQPAHLIDIMPTIADLTGSSIPTTHMKRDLRPVSGVSLRPVFENETMLREKPIHFLFAADRGLRMDDWKLVSFRSRPWELYNISQDPTELRNLAKEEPKRLQHMIETWTEMARDVLHAKPNSYAELPALTEDNQPVHTHPEWTLFTTDPISGRRGNTKASAKRRMKKQAARSIRARKNTQLQIGEDRLNLTFTGEDPGIAFDALPDSLPVGPYGLSFELKSNAVGDGEVFFVIDNKVPLTKGKLVPFSVQSDDQWHSYHLNLTTPAQIQKLRLDVSDGKGNAEIRGLQLEDSNGAKIIGWPAE